MQEEILNKLHTALYHISPLASDRDRIIVGMGEVIWLQSLEKILDALNEEKRSQVVAYLNDEDLDNALRVIEEGGVDSLKIMTDVATELLDEVSAMGKNA